MGSPHYTQSGNPRGKETAFADILRTEFKLIETGMEVMAHSILQLWTRDANEFSANKSYYMSVPFKCDLVKLWLTISANNSGSNTAVFMRDFSAQNLHSDAGLSLWSIPSAALAGETFDITPNQNHQNLEPPVASPFSAGDGIEMLVTGNQNVVMPLFCTMLIKRVN